jgi:hypothetical protein
VLRGDGTRHPRAHDRVWVEQRHRGRNETGHPRLETLDHRIHCLVALQHGVHREQRLIAAPSHGDLGQYELRGPERRPLRRAAPVGREREPAHQDRPARLRTGPFVEQGSVRKRAALARDVREALRTRRTNERRRAQARQGECVALRLLEAEVPVVETA